MGTEAAAPLLLTIRQAAAMLGISRRRFYDIRKLGLVNVVEVGGPQTVRVHVRDVEECAERLRRGEGAA